MEATGIKEKLIAKIEDTNNDELLAEILDWLQLESSSGRENVLVLSEDEERELLEIRAEMMAGDYLTEEEADAELDQWLER